jgi:hypothetical protein
MVTDDASQGGSSSTVSTTTADTSGERSSGDVVDGSDESSTGAPLATWCIESHRIEGPDGPLEGFETPAVLADVDGDDRPELWTLVPTWDPLLEVMDVALAQYDVDATGVATQGDSHGLGGAFSRFADIDGDGRDDVVLVPNGETTASWIDISTGVPGAPQPLDLPEGSDHWFDADGDGAVDIIVLGGGESFVQLWLGDATGGFELSSDLGRVFGDMEFLSRFERVADGVFAVEADNGALGFGYAYSMWELRLDDGVLQTGASTPVIEQDLATAADFDADGLVDFVTWPFDGGTHLWHGAADGPVERVLSEHGRIALVGDFLGTDAPALLVADGDGNVEIHQAPHDPGVPPVVPTNGLGVPEQYEVADVDGDGKDELLRSTWQDERYGYAVVEVRPCE